MIVVSIMAICSALRQIIGLSFNPLFPLQSVKCVKITKYSQYASKASSQVLLQHSSYRINKERRWLFFPQIWIRVAGGKLPLDDVFFGIIIIWTPSMTTALSQSCSLLHLLKNSCVRNCRIVPWRAEKIHESEHFLKVWFMAHAKCKTIHSRIVSDDFVF